MADSGDWAQDFFNFLMSDTQLNNQALAMFLNTTNNLTNRYCLVLGALDSQNLQFDVLLRQAVRNKLLLRPANATITDSADEFPEFAKDFAARLIIEIQSNTSNGLLSELKIDLQAMSDHYNTAAAADLAGQMFDRNTELGSCIASAMAELGKMVSKGGMSKFGQLAKKVSDKITSKFPTLTALVPHVTAFLSVV